MITQRIVRGCEPISHRGDGAVGALAIHGFAGSPFSIRGVAESLAGAAFDVEAPLLPGHGTCVSDLLPMRWDDWAAEVERAHDRLAARVDRCLVVGQSMGATLGLALALAGVRIDAMVCINPLTRRRGADELAMIDELIADGFEIVPGGGSDIADPDGYDFSYDDVPLQPLRSLLVDGVAPIEGRFGHFDIPLRVFTSRADHVVDPADSEHLATTWGGKVDHVWLERSHHVATRDLDREIVETGTVEVARSLVP